VLAFETDLTATVDPFAGSYAIESMTEQIESSANELIERVFAHGSSVDAIEAGFQKREIETSAYRTALEVDSGKRIVVGVNKFTLHAEEPYEPLRVDPAIEMAQRERLATLRRTRDASAVSNALSELAKTAAGTGNILHPMREALRAKATVGEVCHTLRGVWGTYQPRETF
jgi:methylmalonyl-CoA mutase, N-terminal domain